jgi:hypothetical protein
MNGSVMHVVHPGGLRTLCGIHAFDDKDATITSPACPACEEALKSLPVIPRRPELRLVEP